MGTPWAPPSPPTYQTSRQKPTSHSPMPDYWSCAGPVTPSEVGSDFGQGGRIGSLLCLSEPLHEFVPVECQRLVAVAWEPFTNPRTNPPRTTAHKRCGLIQRQEFNLIHIPALPSGTSRVFLIWFVGKEQARVIIGNLPGPHFSHFGFALNPAAVARIVSFLG
jgi:hypothetical protein